MSVAKEIKKEKNRFEGFRKRVREMKSRASKAKTNIAFRLLGKIVAIFFSATILPQRTKRYEDDHYKE
jgi:hypothetical protein